MQVRQEGDSATQNYELTLNFDDVGESAVTLGFIDTTTPGGDEKTGSLLISNAIIQTSGTGALINAQIKKSQAIGSYIHVDQSTQSLATIRVEKLS